MSRKGSPGALPSYLYGAVLAARNRGPRFVLALSAIAVVLALGISAAFFTIVHDSGSVRAVSVSNGDGTATGDGTILGTPVPLAQSYSVQLKGDYVAAGDGMRASGPPGAGTINVPALPGGSTVHKAFLYWSVMNDTTVASLANGTINGNNIVGSLIGKTEDPCWSGDIHNYVADITPYVLPGAANSLTNFASGGLPETTQPLLEGASIVLVYQNNALTTKTIIIHEGAVTFILPPVVTTTFTGFNATGDPSQTTWIVADGQNLPPLSNRTFVDGTQTAASVLNGADGDYWDTHTQVITGFIPNGDTSVQVGIESTGPGFGDCITWVAQVLSVTGPPEPTPTPTPTPTVTATPTPTATATPTPTPTGTPVPVGGLVELSTGDPNGGGTFLAYFLAAIIGASAVAGLGVFAARRVR